MDERMFPDIWGYLQRVAHNTNPIVAAAITTLGCILFPDRMFETALVSVFWAAILDMLAKWWAISANNGGFWAAFFSNKLFSRKMWTGTATKLVSYLFVALLAGLSYRMAPFLEQPSLYIWTFIYFVMFVREVKSIIENLCEAGAPLHILLIWARRKQEQFLESEGLTQDDWEGKL